MIGVIIFIVMFIIMAYLAQLFTVIRDIYYDGFDNRFNSKKEMLYEFIPFFFVYKVSKEVCNKYKAL